MQLFFGQNGLFILRKLSGKIKKCLFVVVFCFVFCFLITVHSGVLAISAGAHH